MFIYVFIYVYIDIIVFFLSIIQKYDNVEKRRRKKLLVKAQDQKKRIICQTVVRMIWVKQDLGQTLVC